MRNRVISSVADILAGLAAFIVFVVADGFLHVAADLRGGVLTLSLLCLGAGLLRGAGRTNAWLKGLLIASAGALALIVLAWNGVTHAFLAILLLAAYLFTVLGVRARQLWPGQSAVKRWTMLLAPVTAVVLVTFSAIPTVATRVLTRRITIPAPAFSMTAGGGEQINSGGLRGRVVILSFWATWCPACRRELPELGKLYRSYQNNSSVSFWAVDVTGNGETAEKARSFMRNAGYALPLAFATEKSPEDLGGDGLPFLVILDRSGRIRLVHNSYDGSEQLQRELSIVIEALLHEG